MAYHSAIILDRRDDLHDYKVLSDAKLIEPPFPSNSIHLWQADLDAVNELDVSLSEDEVLRSSSFKSPRLSRRFTYSRALLRHLVKQYTGIETGAIHYTYGASGKPALAADHRNSLQFNIAHSDRHWLAAFSNGAEVGVDIEVIRATPDEAALVKRFFHRAEIEDYFHLPMELRTLGFFNAWTRKEAILKAYGTGLQRALDSFCVALDPRQPCRLIEPPVGPDGERTFWSLAALDLGPGLVGAVASAAPIESIRSERFESIPATATLPSSPPRLSF